MKDEVNKKFRKVHKSMMQKLIDCFQKKNSKIFIARSRYNKFAWTHIILHTFMMNFFLAFERCRTDLYPILEKSINVIKFQTQEISILFSFGWSLKYQ